MARLLLILPSGTYRAQAFVEAAARLGLELVVASDVELPLATRTQGASPKSATPRSAQTRSATTRRAQTKSIVVDLDDPSAAAGTALELDATWPIDAVVGVDDSSVLVAGSIAARLGIGANPRDALEATRDKLLMRELLEQAEVPQPRFCLLEPGDDPASLEEAASQVGYPLVVKPRTLSASQGVIRVDSPAELLAAAKRSLAIAKSAGEQGGTLLAESFFPGDEVAIEGLLAGGHLEVLAILDKPDPLDGPYFAETLFVTPSRHSPEELRAAISAVQRAVTALGLAEGPIHAEVRIAKDGARRGERRDRREPGRPEEAEEAARVAVVEVAARTIGGLCGRFYELATGVSLEEVVLARAAGLGLPRRHRPSPAGVAMLPITRRGIFVGIRGKEKALAVPGIAGLEVSVPVGREVLPSPEGNRYLGFLFAKALSAKAVEAALRNAQSCLQICIEEA